MTEQEAYTFRWTPSRNNSWPYKVFNHYDTELRGLNQSFVGSLSFVMKQLTGMGADWGQKANRYMETQGDETITIRQWYNNFKLYQNWHRLNELMALCSYFETYIASITNLALESNPGLILGVPRMMDGFQVLIKDIETNKELKTTYVEGCTKGDWTQRFNALSKLLVIDDPVLVGLFKDNLSELDQIRIMRNNVGHSFGRDIEASHNWYEPETLPITHLSEDRFEKWQRLIKKIVSSLDRFVMRMHVGCYQELYFYHKNICMFAPLSRSNKISCLKEQLFRERNFIYSKDFYLKLIEYYENV